MERFLSTRGTEALLVQTKSQPGVKRLLAQGDLNRDDPSQYLRGLQLNGASRRGAYPEGVKDRSLFRRAEQQGLTAACARQRLAVFVGASAKRGDIKIQLFFESLLWLWDLIQGGNAS